MSCFKFTKNGEWVFIAAPIATSVNNVLLEMPGKLPLTEAYVIHLIFCLIGKPKNLSRKLLQRGPLKEDLVIFNQTIEKFTQIRVFQ